MQLAIYNFAFAVGSKAQPKSVNEISISISLENPATLSDILEKIENSTEFKFSYIDDEILSSPINLDPRIINLGDLLRSISQQAGLSFKRVDETIYIKKTRINNEAIIEVIQQNIRVSGTVTIEDGEPLPGATVVEKGTSNGTATDLNGNFTLEVDENATLIVSFVGFEVKEIPVQSRTNINVELVADLTSLQEVVVIGYGTVKKRDLTGAISKVSSEDIKKFPATSISQALQGQTAGIQIIQDSGRPGSSFSVNIRGVGSFGNNEPLYVVDGFPIQDISFINPNDIESISILKDASAAAIYGVRANAGVVIIETKKGVRGEVNVSIDSWAGVQPEPNQLEMLNAQEFAGFALALGESQGKEVLDEWRTPGQLRSINWQDYAFNTGYRQGHNIAVRGGGEKSRTALSIGMVEEDGVVIGSSNTRYNIALNTDYEVSKNISARADLKYAYSKNFLELRQGYYDFMKVFGNVPYLSDHTGTNEPYDENGNYGAPTNSALINASRNVLANALQRDTDNGRNNFLGNVAVDYSFLDGFMATGKLGFQSRNYAGWSFSPKYDRGPNENNPTASYSISQNTTLEYLAEGFLEYRKQIGDHRIEALAGVSAQKAQFQNVYINGRGFLNNQLRDMSAADEIVGRSGTLGTSTFASTFARVNYSYNDKYYITATARRDGVGDRFSRNNLYGTFPSVAFGWNLDQEAFLANSGFNILKLRGSWGETGNSQGIPTFQFLTVYTGGSTADDSGYVFGGTPVSGLAPQTLGNANLVWESQVQKNIGIDGELLEERLYFTLDYFEKSAKDFLLNETIPHQTGFTSRAVNAGNVVNKGLEVLLGYRKTEGDFTWNVSANLTSIHNEITELTGQQDFLSYETVFVPNHVDNWLGFTRSYVGGNIGTFYGYRAAGIFQSEEEIERLNEQAPDGIYQESTGSTPIAPGDRKFVDLNGDGQVTGADREIIGSPFPDFYGGINLNASYKNFELGLSFYGSYGNEILNFVKVELESAGSYGASNAYSNVSREYYNNRWTPDNPSDTYARAVVEDVNKNSRVSDYFVEDGSFLRLRNIQFAYNIPVDALQAIGFKNAKVYVSAQNLLTFTNYSGLDPEIGKVTDLTGRGGVQSRGVDFGSYPTPQTFTLGVNLQL